jgi:hypothetical protein
VLQDTFPLLHQYLEQVATRMRTTFQSTNPLDSPTTAHWRGTVNLKYPNALTQYGAERAMLRIKHHATQMYSSMHTHTHTHTHILYLSIWCGERLTLSLLLHLHSECLWYPYNRRLVCPRTRVNAFEQRRICSPTETVCWFSSHAAFSLPTEVSQLKYYIWNWANCLLFNEGTQLLSKKTA